MFPWNHWTELIAPIWEMPNDIPKPVLPLEVLNCCALPRDMTVGIDNTQSNHNNDTNNQEQLDNHHLPLANLVVLFLMCLMCCSRFFDAIVDAVLSFMSFR